MPQDLEPISPTDEWVFSITDGVAIRYNLGKQYRAYFVVPVQYDGYDGYCPMAFDPQGNTIFLIGETGERVVNSPLFDTPEEALELAQISVDADIDTWILEKARMVAGVF